jgi:hypothetical protein
MGKTFRYTHSDKQNMRWRMEDSRPVSELADRTMNEYEERCAEIEFMENLCDEKLIKDSMRHKKFQ